MLQLTQKDQKRLLNKLDIDGIAIVTRGKEDRLRIWGRNEYLSRSEISRETIQKTKPWMKRKKSLLGPLGTKSLGKIMTDLSRTSIYEE